MVAAIGLHGQAQGGVVAIALGDVAFGVGEDFAVAGTELEADALQGVLEGNGIPEAADGLG